MFNQMLFVVRLFEMHPLGKLLGIVVLCCALGNSTRAQRLITPEDLYKLAAVSDPRLSPAGDRVAYVVSHSDATQNKQESEIWLVAADGSAEPRQLTDAGQSSQSPRWSPDGQWLAFLSARRRSGAAEGSSVVAAKPQVYGLSLAGGEAQRWTNLPNGVSSFNWSPDGTRAIFWVDPDRSDAPPYLMNSSGFTRTCLEHSARVIRRAAGNAASLYTRCQRVRGCSVPGRRTATLASCR